MAKKKFKTGRRQHIFWLDVWKGEATKLYDTYLKISENALHFEMEVLKGGRLFSQAVREGLVIWVEARKGETLFFEKRFPGVAQSIVAKYQNRQISDLQNQLGQLQDQLDAMNFGTQPLMLGAPAAELEEELPIVVDKPNPAANFMKALLGLQS